MRVKRLELCLLTVLVALFAYAFVLQPGKTLAAVNAQINFQGKLTNPDGTNVADGTYSLRFRVYTDPTADAANTCSANTCKWEETQSSVTVSSGIFQVALGSVNTTLTTAVDFNVSGLYLAVKVGSDAEMTPRIQFTAAPYAFNADKVGGMSASSFVQLNPGSQQSGSININGNVLAGGTYNGNTFTGSSLVFSATQTASIQAASGQALSLDSGSSGTIAIGGTNATNVALGKSGGTVTSAANINVNSGTTVPSSDQVSIDNTSSTGVTAAGVNGFSIKYKGGAAAVEASGMRIDYTPGTTSGGVWSGLRVVQTAGAANGVTSYGIKLEGAGTGSGTDAAVEVGTGWDIGVDVQSGGIQLASQTDPAAPATGNLRIYAKTIAGRVVPKWIGPAGVDTPFQSSFGFNRIAMMTPQNGTGATTIMTEFGGAFTNGGTNTPTYSTPALTSTNLATSVRRARLTTSATAGSIAYHLPAAGMVWRGNAAGLGGFFFTTRFTVASTVAANRGFVGLVDNGGTAPTNVDPITATTPGRLGLAFNNNTGNLKWINNTSGTAPIGGGTDLGTSFAVNNTSALYELVIFSPPNGAAAGTITYRVANITTGAVTSDTVVNSNLPAATSFLAPEYWISNQGTGTAISLDDAGWYLESDN